MLQIADIISKKISTFCHVFSEIGNDYILLIHFKSYIYTINNNNIYLHNNSSLGKIVICISVLNF